MEPAWIKDLVAKLQTLSDQQQEVFNPMETEENFLGVSFEDSMKNKEKQNFLQIPKLKHHFLMSPPPSPPENWHQNQEDINRIPFFDLEPIFVPEKNQTILFSGQNRMDVESNSRNDQRFLCNEVHNSQPSSVSSSEYSSLNSSSSSLPSHDSPKLRVKRKQDDESRISSINFLKNTDHPSVWLEEDPSVMQEKEERRRRNNLRQNRQNSFSSTSTSARWFSTQENQGSSSEEENFSLPSIVITHDSFF